MTDQEECESQPSFGYLSTPITVIMTFHIN